MGKTHKSKARCSACPSLCFTRGIQAAHRNQTLGQMELFIQLYTLFGWCMSFSDWETIFCVSWWITNFNSVFQRMVGVYLQFFSGYWSFLEINTKAGHASQVADYSTGAIKSQLDFWVSKQKNSLKSNNPRWETNCGLFLTPFFHSIKRAQEAKSCWLQNSSTQRLFP